MTDIAQLEALLNALQGQDYGQRYQQAYERMGTAQAGLDEALQDERNYSTRRTTGWLSGLGETIFDAIQRQRKAPGVADVKLEHAMAAGQMADLQAQIEAELQRQKAIQDRLSEINKADNDLARKKDLYQFQKETDQKYQKSEVGNVSVREVPDGQGGMRTVAIDPRGNVVRDYGTVPTQPSASELKRQDEQKERQSADAKLLEQMRGVYEIMNDPHFESAVGPIDASAPARWWDKLRDSPEYRLREKIGRTTGEQILRLGAEVLKGSQTEGEWGRIADIFPGPDDHPSVWREWSEEASRLIMAGRPDLAPEIEKLMGGATRNKANSGGAIQVSSPAEAMQLPPGTEYVTPDGQRFVR